MIYLLKEKAVPTQIQNMLQEYENMIKIVIDIRRRCLSGSEQDDLWGANWYPGEQRIEFESLINIRPRLGNRNIVIQDETLRKQVKSVTREILGEVQ